MLRCTAWSLGQDPDSSLITLALDSRLASDPVTRMRRQSSVQSLPQSRLEVINRVLSQSASCLVNVVGGSVEVLSDSGYSSWEGGTGECREESDIGSDLGAPTRPPSNLLLVC